MCGIFCAVSRRQHVPPARHVKDILARRGPDARNQVEITSHHWDAAEPEATYTTCYSTVLSLRGEVTVAQPFQRSDSESTLCWNGEAWTIGGVRPTGNDTAKVFTLLRAACDDTAASAHHKSLESVTRALSRVAGPYAFVYYDEPSSNLYFGRDFLGRRSLLWSITKDDDFLLSSVTEAWPGEVWSEVEADGVYCVHLARSARTKEGHCEQYGNFAVSKVPYLFTGEESDNVISVLPKLSLNRQLPPNAMILNEHSPSVSVLEALLHDSLYLRVTGIPNPPRPNGQASGPQQARLGILFSGGLDCTLLARMSHDILPLTEPIDLLNVAFENPRVHKSKTERPFELCPDRITGRQSFVELQRVCPARPWRLYTIDVPYHELLQHKQEIVKLMHPHNTEMDFSIASALYFAARGDGDVVLGKGDSPCYHLCPARVLLSGLGADELFAGYTRHATAFNRHGFQGLLDELDVDIARLGKRNLGRDDRIISNWGREARFPFLDEKLVGWALSAPISEKCDFGVEDKAEATDSNSCSNIEPGKKVLRCLAWKLGMKEVAREKKRAIQFGARTAKMETGKTKGTTLLS